MTVRKNGRTTRTRPTAAARRAAARRKLARFKRILRAQLPELQAKYGVTSLSVFGSYVRGDARRKSDLDVLVEFEPENDRLSLFGFLALENELSDLLGVKVDLVEQKTLKPRVGQRILREAQTV
jgi:predicted nucleotidyltransferase